MIKKFLSFFLTASFFVPVSLTSFSQETDQAIPYASIQLRDVEQTGLSLRLSADTYELRDVRIEGKDYQQLTVPGAGLSSEAGAPQLPMKADLIGVPPGADIELNVVRDDFERLEGKFHIMPAPSPAPITDDLQPGGQAFVENPEVYNQDAVHPQKAVRLGDEAWLRDQRIIPIQFFPFQYNPLTGDLIWHRYLEVEINFKGGEKLASAAGMVESPDSPFDGILSSELINYEQAKEWRANSAPARIETLSSSADQLPGERYKIPITEDGIYKLTYDALKAVKLDVDNLDATTLRITSQGQEVAIYVKNLDGDAHKFSPGEYILFYGQAYDGALLAERYRDEDKYWLKYFETQTITGSYTTWAPEFNAAMVEKYTDQNVYWLSYGGQPGLRMAGEPAIPGGAAVSATYRESVHAEQQNLWKTTLFTSEDTWFWDRIQTSASATRAYTTTLHHPVIDGIYTAAVRGEVVAAAYNDYNVEGHDHHIQVYFNDPQHNNPPLVDAVWEGKSRYRFEASVPQTQLSDGENQLDIVYYYTGIPPGGDDLYFDWFEVDYDRQFTADNNEEAITTKQSGSWKYEVDGFTETDIEALDITAPYTPTLLSGISPPVTGTVGFEVDREAGARFFVGQPRELSALQILDYQPPDLSGPADYVFITHERFYNGVNNTFAAYREGQGLTTKVVDVEDLYNQFNFGIYHPIAIKNFIAYTFSHWSAPPTYVLLVGDGHWNFHGSPNYDNPEIYMPPNLVWVDPWQGEVDSANLLANVVGDDPLADVLIGRLPVNNNVELQNIYDKTVQYEERYENYGPEVWQSHFLFITDDTPDNAGDFVSYTKQIITDYITPTLTADTIYLDDYKDVEGGCEDANAPASISSLCPKATTDIIKQLNDVGASVVNYNGHASLNLWTNEKIFTNQEIPLLNNGQHLPVVLSMTCLDGYWIHPDTSFESKKGPSLIEEMLRAQDRGIVASFSPTGLGVAMGHEDLQRGFYNSLFEGVRDMGALSQAAKLNLYATNIHQDLLHTYTVFGDPALKILVSYANYLPQLIR
jgi:hypothetical protein